MRANQCIVLTIAAVVLATPLACKEQSGTDIAAASARAPLYHTIGPQPGEDRALLTATNPYHDDRDVLAEGRKLFVWYNCAGCHGDHAGGGMGPSLRDTSWRYGNADEQIFSSIAEGRRYGMPAWGTKLNRDQIWKIVAYIKSMRTPDEPDAPVVPK